MLDPDPSLLAVYCSQCETLIGFYVQVGPEIWLQVGGAQSRITHGRCCHCHTEYHYVASTKTIRELLEKRQNLVDTK